MTDQFDISRRKALAALGTIGVASAGAGLGTSAYFSDQETFNNNGITAGTLDMGVGYSAHYSDWSDDEDVDVPNVRMYAGDGDTGGVDDLTDNEVGLPANAAWLIAVSDDDPDDDGRDGDVAAQFLDNTQYDSYNDDGLDCPLDDTDQADGIGRPVIKLEDVKPGDFGEVTFDFILCDNPGFVWLDGTLRSASENGLTEPEADDPDEVPGEVELLDTVQAAVWLDDGNNYQNGDESPLVVGSIAEVLGMLGEGSLGTALNGDLPAPEGGGAAGARNCFSGGTEHSFVFAWWVPVDHGNEIQSDSMTFDLGLYAEQCRHNDGSGMNNGDTGGDTGDGDDDDDNGTGGGAGDVDGDGAISFLAACVADGRDVGPVTISQTAIRDTDDDGDPTAVDWSTGGVGIDALVVKYGSATPPQGPKYTTYTFDSPQSSGTAVTGADDESILGSPETTSSSPGSESDPCPDGYSEGDRLEY
ncbi:SipW-dependent-type signal peptide-containing protein [Haloplanus litoreus]|uniref:SipW-dependent-type signal peptide-containing protein n=2 Tax=Haloplanus litoreus TaxID=767515 RepID=A0ABD6A1A3_9EURY